MGTLHFYKQNHSYIKIEKERLIFPSGHIIYTSEEFNKELEETIMMARIMGIQVKTTYEHKVLRFEFIDNRRFQLVIRINKNNRISLVSYWTINGDDKEEYTYSPNKFTSIIKKVKEKL